MAKVSGSNSIPFWGLFATEADLPNSVAAATQKSSVETGDQAYTTSNTTFWVCTDATVGAAVWMPLAAGSSIIIFQPGGTASSRVVTTYAELKAAVAEFPGPPTIIFDDTFSTPIVLPVDTWTVMYQMTWRGISNFVSAVQVQLADGFVCQVASGVCALAEYHGDVALTALSPTTAPFPITAAAGSATQLFGSPAPVTAPISGGAAGVFSVAAGVIAAFDVFGLSFGANAINVDGQIFFGAFDGADLTTQWLIGTGTMSVSSTDGSARFEQNQTGISSQDYGNFLNNYLGGILEKRTPISSTGGVPIAIQSTDRLMEVDTSSGAISNLVLNSGDPGQGMTRIVWIEDVGGQASVNPVTLQRQGGQTVNGAAVDPVLSTNWFKAKLATSDGAAYTLAIMQPNALAPLLIPFAGALTPTGLNDTYTADATGTSATVTPLAYTLPEDAQLVSFKFNTYINTLVTNAMTVNIKQNGATIDTFTVAAGVTGLTTRSPATSYAAGDTFDIETTATAGTVGTARFSILAQFNVALV